MPGKNHLNVLRHKAFTKYTPVKASTLSGGVYIEVGDRVGLWKEYHRVNKTSSLVLERMITPDRDGKCWTPEHPNYEQRELDPAEVGAGLFISRRRTRSGCHGASRKGREFKGSPS